VSFVAPYRVAADRPEYDAIPAPSPPRSFDVRDMLASSRRAAEAEEVIYEIDAPDDQEGSTTHIERWIVIAIMAVMLPLIAAIWGYLFFGSFG
jgi:hypothetical protein